MDVETLRELPDSVYSNFDHEIDNAVVEDLRKGDCRAQHAALNFCAWVYFKDGSWHSAIYQWGLVRAHAIDKDINALIRAVNEEYGDA